MAARTSGCCGVGLGHYSSRPWNGLTCAASSGYIYIFGTIVTELRLPKSEPSWMSSFYYWLMCYFGDPTVWTSKCWGKVMIFLFFFFLNASSCHIEERPLFALFCHRASNLGKPLTSARKLTSWTPGTSSSCRTELKPTSWMRSLRKVREMQRNVPWVGVPGLLSPEQHKYRSVKSKAGKGHRVGEK